MKQSMKKASIRLTAIFLFAAMAISFLPKFTGDSDVSAAVKPKKDISNTCLGTTGMAKPAAPETDKFWSGSFVYYGVFGYPRDPDYPDQDDEIKFRVLDPLSDKYGNVNGTLFLDSDKCLYNDCFDADGKANFGARKANQWAFSDIKQGLNGDKFLNKEGVFTDAEKNAISESYAEPHMLQATPDGSDVEWLGYVRPWAATFLKNYVPLTGEKVFILDVEEISYLDYGYNMLIEAKNRVKGPSTVNDHYFLRSEYESSETTVGAVYGGGNDGHIGDQSCQVAYAVCPAMNIDYSYIIFSSLISGKFNEVGSEYKLTIKDDDLSVAVPAGEGATLLNDTVTIPYKVSGKDAGNTDRVSVLILDSEYRDDDTKILYYDSLGGAYSENGQGTFKLPSDLKYEDWGSKYFVYILAEDINGTKQTDYASFPEYVNKPVDKTKYTVRVESDGADVSASTTVGYRGTKVTVKATPKEGYVFKQWKVVSGGVTLSSLTKTTATFYITGQNVVIKAICEKIELTLNKTETKIICGSSETLKATLKASKDKISWTSSDSKIATVDSKGKITAKQAGTATITAAAAGKTCECKVTVLYKDVTDPKEFWYQPTYYLTGLGVVKGYDNQTLFKPANDCTRAQMVTFLWRLNGSPKPKTTKNPFTDVKKDDYFYNAVLWAVENKITTGTSQTTFSPKNVCSRAQTVTFLYRMAGSPSIGSAKNPFKDVKSSDYFYKPVIWAYVNNIVAGSSDGTFKPQGKCLRRQMVTFLYKYDKNINGKG